MPGFVMERRGIEGRCLTVQRSGVELVSKGTEALGDGLLWKGEERS